MSEGMSPEQIAQVFGSLARIEQKIDSGALMLQKHIDDDNRIQGGIFTRVEALQVAGAKQKGFVAAISTVGILVSTAVGWFLDWKFGGGHSH